MRLALAQIPLLFVTDELPSLNITERCGFLNIVVFRRIYSCPCVNVFAIKNLLVPEPQCSSLFRKMSLLFPSNNLNLATQLTFLSKYCMLEFEFQC